MARRGRPSAIWSDNGLNFVGAHSELKDLGTFLQNQELEVFENEGVQWKFIPPKSPNFGGLWESGVRACKFHLKRVMGNASLTFEQFSTLLAQVEATLNSRPLLPLSPDPNDFDTLTPAHFLIGRRLTTLPDMDLRDISCNRLSKYQHLQQIHQHFWSRWSKEYLNLLQQRHKWKYPQRGPQLGDLVLIREDNAPPLHCKTGRISVLCPSPDNQCRVASVRTPTGELKRPISKLCVLPVNEDMFSCT